MPWNCACRWRKSRPAYSERPEGSESKLSTFRDGFRILTTIVQLMKEERPLPFFTGIFGVLLALAIGHPYLSAADHLSWKPGLVPRFPTAILASAMMILAFLSLACGFILDTVSHGRREMKRLRYLEFPAAAAAKEG